MDLKPGAPSMTAFAKYLTSALALLAAASALAVGHSQPVRTLPPPATVTGLPSAAAPRNSAPDAIGLSVRDPIRVQSGGGPNPLWNAALSAGAALLGAIVGYAGTTRNARATIIQKTNELEIDSIEHRLTEFVGPFMHLSGENKILAAELKRKQPGGQDFRTLTALLTPGWLDTLSPGDRNLLDAVVANGRELRKLMAEKGGSAVSMQLTPYFNMASAHFRFLDLAASGSLDMDPERYSGYVYPRELDGVMLAEQKRLHNRREILRSRPGKPHPAMQDLDIPAELKLSDADLASGVQVDVRSPDA